MESILTSIKKLLGIGETDISFDPDIIMHINSAIFELTQIGVGPSAGYHIENNEATWKDYLLDINQLEAVKTCIYLKVKMVFDPPQNSFTITSYEKQIERYEFRLNIHNNLSESGV